MTLKVLSHSKCQCLDLKFFSINVPFLRIFFSFLLQSSFCRIFSSCLRLSWLSWVACLACSAVSCEIWFSAFLVEVEDFPRWIFSSSFSVSREADFWLAVTSQDHFFSSLILADPIPIPHWSAFNAESRSLIFKLNPKSRNLQLQFRSKSPIAGSGLGFVGDRQYSTPECRHLAKRARVFGVFF